VDQGDQGEQPTKDPNVTGAGMHDEADSHSGTIGARRMDEERFRVLLEHSTDAVIVADKDATLLYASPAIEHLFGRAPDDVVGAKARHLVHPDDLPRLADQTSGIYTTPGSSTTIEFRIRNADDEYRWVQAHYTNLMDNPHVRGVVIHVRDTTDHRNAEDALRESEERFRSLVEHSNAIADILDRDGRIIWISENTESLLGHRAEDLVGLWAGEHIHPDDQPLAVAGFAEVAHEPGHTVTIECRVKHASGEWRWFECTMTNRFDDPSIGGVIGNFRDITDRRQTQRDNQRLIDVFDATDDLVGIADPQGELLYLNAASRRFFGVSETELVSALELIQSFPPSVTDRLVTEIQPALEHQGMWSGELSIPRADGELVPMLAQLLVHRDPEQNMEFFSGVLHDISERKQFESALEHQATHDPLTGMPNRSLLLGRLDVALSRAKRHNLRVAVLFLDLDHFKVVNDSLGHDLGDRLLVAIADRLQLALRPGDTIARFGGDEFVVLCQDLHSRSDAIAIADRVITSVSGPFVVDDAEVFVGASIGIAFPDDPDSDPGTLIRDADAAMYRAKERGRGRWEIFDNELRASAVDRLDIENALRRALDRRELRVFYQPIIELDSGSICGVEALLRWEHRDRGLLLPGDFIAIAEETGLIVPIGLWVLDQAARQVQRWQASIPDMGGLVVSVNLSGRQLGHPKLADDVAAVLSETGLAPERLELEITESVLMDDVEMSNEMLGKLDELGVRLVVDDFGTGYSSMSYLRRFPVDLLKVDKNFVDGLGSDPGDSAIVTAIVTLAHALGLEAVAEGVETSEQLDELRTLGCDKAQGYLIARPISGDDLAELLVSRPFW